MGDVEVACCVKDAGLVARLDDVVPDEGDKGASGEDAVKPTKVQVEGSTMLCTGEAAVLCWRRVAVKDCCCSTCIFRPSLTNEIGFPVGLGSWPTGSEAQRASLLCTS